jgi:hypothetical protein
MVHTVGEGDTERREGVVNTRRNDSMGFPLNKAVSF